MELNALALPFAFSLTLQTTAENLAGNKLHPLKPAEQTRRKKLGVLTVAHPGVALFGGLAATLRCLSLTAAQCCISAAGSLLLPK